MLEKQELKIDVEPLRKNNLCIATPAYGGNININFDQSQLSLQHMLLSCQIPHTFYKMGNESLVPRGRNKLTNHMLQGDFTHLLFIDGDIEFNPTDVIIMLYLDRDIIGGSYPMKGLNWENVKKAVKLNPDISAEDLEKCAAQWTGHFHEGRTKLYPFEPVEVYELATGFTMFSRKVFETLKDKVNTYQRASNEPDMTERVEDYFTCGVDVSADRYESEDYSICRRWREVGGKVFCAPWFKLNHHGSHSFKGDLNRVIELLGEVS